MKQILNIAEYLKNEYDFIDSRSGIPKNEFVLKKTFIYVY